MSIRRTETMNRVAGEKATSSQDAQRQQQGQPTAAQQAQGMQPSAKMTDDHLPAAAAGTRRSKDGGPRLLNGDGRARPLSDRGPHCFWLERYPLGRIDDGSVVALEFCMPRKGCTPSNVQERIRTITSSSTGFRYVRNKQTTRIKANKRVHPRVIGSRY